MLNPIFALAVSVIRGMAFTSAWGSSIGCDPRISHSVGYAGGRLVAVVTSGGDVEAEFAGAAAIDTLRGHDAEVTGDRLVPTLHTVVGDMMERGTTTALTALLWSGPRLALAHLGDARAFMLRDDLFPLVLDPQPLCVVGRDEEDFRRPPASGLDGVTPYEPSVWLRQARPGDRYLLCSGGLAASLDGNVLYTVLMAEPDPAAAVRRLISLAENGGGCPDDLTCVVADLTH
jgi:protein phosphatase